MTPACEVGGARAVASALSTDTDWQHQRQSSHRHLAHLMLAQPDPPSRRPDTLNQPYQKRPRWGHIGISFRIKRPDRRSPLGVVEVASEFCRLFGRARSTERVNSRTGLGRCKQILDRHLRWVLSTSHRFVTLTRLTWVSAPRTAWRYLAAWESPPEGRTPIECRVWATSLAVPPNSSINLAASSRSAARSASKRMLFPFSVGGECLSSAVPFDTGRPVVREDVSLGFSLDEI
jgi:hypothetical protein